jgi:hypothetical protein
MYTDSPPPPSDLQSASYFLPFVHISPFSLFFVVVSLRLFSVLLVLTRDVRFVGKVRSQAAVLYQPPCLFSVSLPLV